MRNEHLIIANGFALLPQRGWFVVEFTSLICCEFLRLPSFSCDFLHWSGILAQLVEHAAGGIRLTDFLGSLGAIRQIAQRKSGLGRDSPFVNQMGTAPYELAI